MGILDDIRESNDVDYGITRGAARLAGRGAYEAAGSVGSFYGQTFKEAGLGFVPQAAGSLYSGLGKILGFGKEDAVKILKRVDTNTDELEGKEDAEIRILKRIDDRSLDLFKLVRDKTNKTLEKILDKIEDIGEPKEGKKKEKSLLETLLAGAVSGLIGALNLLKDAILKIVGSLGEILSSLKTFAPIIKELIKDIIGLAGRAPSLFSGLAGLATSPGALAAAAPLALGAGVIAAQNAIKEKQDEYAKSGDYKQLRMSLEQDIRQGVTDPNTGATPLNDEDIQRLVDQNIEQRGYLKDNPKLLKAKSQFEKSLKALEIKDSAAETARKAAESRAALKIEPGVYGAINQSDDLAKFLEKEAEKERQAPKAVDKFLPQLPPSDRDYSLKKEEGYSAKDGQAATGESYTSEEIQDVLKQFKGRKEVDPNEFKLKVIEKYGQKNFDLLDSALEQLQKMQQPTIVPVPVPAQPERQGAIPSSTGPIASRSNDPGSAFRMNSWEGMLQGAYIPLVPGSMFS